MHMSKRGQAMLKRLEDCSLKAYPDSGGVWTIGYGHTGPDVREGSEITELEAEQLFASDLRRAERGVTSRCLGIGLNQNQFDALTSLVFNVGVAAFERSRMFRDLRARDFEAAAKEFDDWVHDNGRRMSGLVARRKEEHGLFNEA